MFIAQYCQPQLLLNPAAWIFIILTIFAIAKCKTFTQWLFRNLTECAITIWFAGFCIYMIGFSHKIPDLNISVWLRSVLSSAEMFISHSDFIEIFLEKESMATSPYYAIPFWIIHFLAVLISFLFLIRLFGIKTKSWFVKYIWRFIKREPQDIFFFFGINRYSIILAKSITADKKIIFINTANEHHEGGGHHLTLGKLFEPSGKNLKDSMEEIDSIKNAIVLKASKKLHTALPHTSGNLKEGKLFEYMGINICDFLMESAKTNKKKINFFFLSEDEQDNIKSAMALKNYFKELEKYDTTCIDCYCHARANKINNTLISCPGLEHKVHLLDSSYYAVQQLKSNIKNHPINFVEVDKDKALVKTPFCGLVIGFGETGRDALRFLYEYSSFVCDESGNESKKQFIVVDEKLEGTKSGFIKDTPVLEATMENTEFNWCNYSTNSSKFWEMLKNKINTINYIVITIGDDKQAMDLAIQIADFAHMNRNFYQTGFNSRLKNFRIYLRVKNGDHFSTAEKICDTYNKEHKDLIAVFGSEDSVFDYKTISIEHTHKAICKFYYGYRIADYNRARNEIEKYLHKIYKETDCVGRNLKNLHKEIANLLLVKNLHIAESELKSIKDQINGQIKCLDNEDSIRKELCEIDEIHKDVEQSLNENLAENLVNFRRKYKYDKEESQFKERDGISDSIETWYMEQQDKSNYWHNLTKKELCRNFKEIIENIDNEKEDEIIRNLRRCEHLRWNSKMILMGFRKNRENYDEKDMKKRTHKCIVGCSELETNYSYTIPYDKIVIKTEKAIKRI